MRIILILMGIFAFTHIYAQYNDVREHSESCKLRYNTEKAIYSNHVEHELMENYDLKFMALDLYVTNTSTYHTGNVSLLSEVVENPLDTFVFELNNQTIDSILYLGQSMNYSRTGDLVFVYLPAAVNVGELINMQVFYRGFSAGDGMSHGYWSGQHVVWTLSESWHAKDWIPCKQDLRDKIDSVDVSITTLDHLKVGSNGLLVSVDTLENNKLRYNWESRYPMVYYLISIAVADYQEYNVYAHPPGTTDSLLIQNFIYNSPSYLSSNKANIDKTAGMIELFSEKFTLYPFMDEKYGHCTAPLGGGMEHQTMSTMDGFDHDLISHELGHMWFGDNVTCATWQDIWINEGFATYSEYIVHEFLNSEEDADDWLAATFNSAMSQPGGHVYIPFEEVSYEPRIFSYQLSYSKGAALLHMLRFEMQNDDWFFETLQAFQTQFKDSVATGEDFKHVAEAVSGMDFDQFFDQWYYGEGYPTYDLNYSQAGDTLYFQSEQEVSASTPLFQMLMEYKVEYVGGDSIIQVYHNTHIENYKIYFPYEVTGMAVDPNNEVLDGESTISVGICKKDTPDFELNVFPNPVQEKLRLEISGSSEDTFKLELRDVSGKVLEQKKILDSSCVMDLSALKSGVYFLSIQTHKGIKLKKLIKE